VQKQGRIDAAMIFGAVEELGLPVRDWLPFVCRNKERRTMAGRTEIVAG